MNREFSNLYAHEINDLLWEYKDLANTLAEANKKVDDLKNYIEENSKN